MEENNSFNQGNMNNMGFGDRTVVHNAAENAQNAYQEQQNYSQNSAGNNQQEQEYFSFRNMNENTNNFGNANTYTNNNAGNQTGPEPMPNEDTTYRFKNQNTGNVSGTTTVEPGVKLNNNVLKIVVGGIFFGVIAAICFFGVNKALGHIFGNSGSSGSIEPVNIASSQVPAGTGSAITSTADVSGVVEQVMPAMVAITEKTTVKSYFGQSYQAAGEGSGFIIKQEKDNLLIATNAHVVEGANEIIVQFIDGETAPAVVKGKNTSEDLAVISIDLSKMKDSTKKEIKVAKLGSSDDAKVGEMVIALGNALGYGQTVTVGYLSAKDREFNVTDDSGKVISHSVIQMDAAINPGNSGGALINTRGEVIGINCGKSSASSFDTSSIEGVSYAIPMSNAITLINNLMNKEVLKDSEKGFIGINGQNITESISENMGMPVGVYVTAVHESEAADKAGIKRGDIITKINDMKITTFDELKEEIQSTKVGTEVTITFMRSYDGKYKEKQVKVTLGKRSDAFKESDNDKQDSGNNSYPEEGLPGSEGSDGDGYELIPWGGSIY